MKKNVKKETRHLVASTDAATTICGRPVGKVLLWAKKYEPGAETMSVCGRCKALKAGKARTEKIVKKHERIREAGKPKAGTPGLLSGDHWPDATPKEKKPGKRQPALLVLGDRMPEKLHVTFKGVESDAIVHPDGRIETEGGIYNSPSRAGKAVAGREVDGWTFWSYLKADGSLEKLDALRKAVA